MNQYMKTGLAVMAAGMLLASCSSDTPEAPVSLPEGAVTFKATMVPSSRATETSFEQGDRIAVMHTLESEPTAWNYLSPLEYEWKGNRFEPATEAQTIINTNGERRGYIAYYPFSRTLIPSRKFAVKNDQTTHASYTASDLCLSWTGFTDATSVQLTFLHCLSHVVVNIGGYNLAGEMKAELKNVATETTIDVLSRTFQPTATRGDVAMRNNGTLSYKAIVSPQTIAAGKEFLLITLNGRQFNLASPSDMEFSSGREYVFNVEVVNGEIVGFDAKLRPWETE